MAHVGKNYKLLHRRDICLGCKNYRVAFPEAWFCNWAIHMNGPGQITWRNDGILFPPIDPPETHRPRWETVAMLQNSVSFKVIIEFDGYTPLQQTSNLICRFHTGSHYWMETHPRQRQSGFCNIYDYDQFGVGFNVVLDPVVAGGNSGSGTFTIRPASWSQWPP